ncbi:SusC/RagA family TonB-linked outer membrane protein [Salegentibacter flavus]|uniref:TonB-linked outer membrane protein, SusC/RagA family n=1 Tax=Salegentibacter flavus TaxID=287099 RepID=A0A1I5ALI3_9FLAO|nr:TonB-dependent receptor [Salegentibacter flavus]SFN63278.1 TonB-linked outer membrane protein, SusC/RagA family [Salegentibacter flavus]
MKNKLHGILTLLLAFVVQITFAQEKTVTGTITDETGLPLPGVNVIEEGTSNGAQSDFDGNYSISVEPGDLLVFSYVGFETQSIVVGSSDVYNVTMAVSAAALEEVVITGYVAQRKSDITGSLVEVDAGKLSEYAAASVDQALQGNVAGLTVSQSSGTPGSVANIRIRGLSSITAGNEPLYVIDGVPVNNGNVSASTATSSISALAAIDQSTIESITVLKDASATAQYGARGANGVILINTKSGKYGKTVYNFSSQVGFQNDATKGPTPLTSAQRLELASEAYYNDGYFDSEQAAEDYILGNIGLFTQWDEDGRPESNWSEAVANDDALYQQHSLSASGGGEDNRFFASIGYLQQEATVIGSDFERISGSLNFSKDFSPSLKFSSNNSGAYTLQNAFLEQSAYFASPRTAKYFMNSLRYPYNEDGSPAEIGGALPNPLIGARDDFNENRFTRIISGNSLDWDIGSGFKAGTKFNVDLQLYNYRTYGNRNYGYGVPVSGEASQYDRTNAFYVLQNYLEYDFEINQDHAFNLKAVQEYQASRSYFLGGDGNNFADDGLFYLASAGTPLSVTSSFSDWYMGAYLGLLQYSAFDSKYVLNLSYRKEGNSRFQEENRWGDFYSIGAAWNLHKENFLSSSDAIDYLKLRGSYGVTGNANIGLNNYQSLFTYGVDYNGEGAQVVDTFGNEELSWEINKTLDVGVEFGLFQDALTGNVAYFRRNSEDLLLDVPLSQTTGFNTQTRNIGALVNEGLEVQLNANIVNTKDVSFSIGGNFTTVENEVTKLPLDPNGVERTITTTITRIETGHPVREFYMPTWAGVNPETGMEEFYVNGVDGETTTNFNDAEAVFQGSNAIPTLTAGMNLNFSFKGFFVNANAYYAGGHKIYEGWHLYLHQTNGYPILAYNGYQSLMDRWQEPGDIARHGKFTSAGEPWQRHSKYLYDADFLRLRTVTVGYDLPSSAMEQIGMTSVRVFLRGNNLATWVKDDNLLYDPEQDLGGETGLETPPTKAFLVGLNLTF